VLLGLWDGAIYVLLIKGNLLLLTYNFDGHVETEGLLKVTTAGR